MFVPGNWVAAFINSLAAQGGEAEEGFSALKALTPWVKSLPGEVFGSSAAEKLEKTIRRAAAGTVISPALEVTIRFLALMVKKNTFRYIDTVIDETEKFLDRKNGVVKAVVEYVFPLPDDESRIKEAIAKQTGAARVDITMQVKAELIGGYRLRIGDEVIDASIRSQLRQLETCLAAGDGGN